MKKILNIVQQFLRKYPATSEITSLGQMFKLQYTYSSPYTNSKHSKQVLLPIANISSNKILQSETKKLIYSDKGRIEQESSFDSINVKQKHEKLLQDSCFGKASHTKDFSRWIYVAEVKQQPVKSIFNEGKGKEQYKYDFGEGYQGVKESGIFLWDKNTKSVQRVDIDKDLIPAYVSFSNEKGSQIIFHAYKKQHFGHGLIHCLNRKVNIYSAKLRLQNDEKAQKEKKEGEKSKLKLISDVVQVIDDGKETNMFPRVSPCFNYLVYLSGTGKTHTFYMDFVVAKKEEGKWIESRRLKQNVVGFYDSLTSYIVQKDQKTYAIFQTFNKPNTNIYKFDLQTGELINLTQKYENSDFSISNVDQNGLITGVVTTNNYHTFFYSQGDNIVFVDPPHRQNFVVENIQEPIPAVLVYAKEEDVYEEYRDRTKKRPLLVNLHGGPHGSSMPALTCLRYSLLKLGYAILMPDFPGSAGFGQQYIEQALGGIGQKDAKPIIQLIEKVLTQNENFDRTKVHASGGSYGGYLSALFGARYPSIFRSAIIMNGVLNNAAMMWFTDIPEWVPVQTRAKSQLHELTQQDYIQMHKQSATSQPMKIPTLQFLGAKDRRVPYRQGLLFDAMTKEVGTPITTYVYEESNHNLADSVQTAIDIVVKSLIFLEEIREEEKEDK